MPALVLLVAFLVTAAVVEERSREAKLPSQAQELLGLIESRRAAVSELEAEAQDLSVRLSEAQATRGETSQELRALLEQVDALRAGAGLEAVEGEGLVVDLSDSEDPPQTRGELTDLRIQDLDLRLVVNALWRAGARAVAVDGRRVVSTTAIREAGGAIQVNFSPVASPYRIEAVGDPGALRAGLEEAEIAQQFELWTQAYGLGFAVRPADRLSLAPVEGAGELDWAVPQA